jgi:hypothetical protein
MKRCKKCGVEQPLENFYRASTSKDGLRGDCKACNLAAKKRYYDANRTEAIARVKRWQQANQERVNAVQRARRANPEVKRQMREYHLQRTFGISISEYEAMLAVQDGGCAICKRPPSPSISLHVDHDHETGRIRGLLCFRCNNSLGDLDDDPALLRAALRYVEPDEIERDPRIEARLAELKAMRPAWAAG